MVQSEQHMICRLTASGGQGGPSKHGRSGVRSAMRAASQLPGKGPTDVDDAPAPARKSKIRL